MGNYAQQGRSSGGQCVNSDQSFAGNWATLPGTFKKGSHYRRWKSDGLLPAYLRLMGSYRNIHISVTIWV